MHLPSIQPLTLSTAPIDSQAVLQAVKDQLGMIPNLHATLAHSPAVLESYMVQAAKLTQGLLDCRLREQIALAVAGSNGCNYCASAHTLLGAKAGLDRQELSCNLSGRSNDAKTEAALDFVKNIVASRGQITAEDLATVRAAGYSEGEIVEMIAHVGMNIFTNYFNLIAGTEIDFPLVITRS